jgi:hypothetical protein
VVDLWFPYPASLDPDAGSSCWDLAGWGFSTGQGHLYLVHTPDRDQERGIYMPVSGDADIRFTIELNELRTRLNKIGFLNFGVVQNDPISIYSGGFFSYQQITPGAGSPVRVLISGSRQPTQKISTLEAGFRHEVLLSITDDLMTVYLNGEQVGDPVRVPAADRAFWIGYVLPSQTELDAVIEDFRIERH